jgi:hypothetical protein
MPVSHLNQWYTSKAGAPLILSPITDDVGDLSGSKVDLKIKFALSVLLRDSEVSFDLGNLADTYTVPLIAVMEAAD